MVIASNDNSSISYSDTCLGSFQTFGGHCVALINITKWSQNMVYRNLLVLINSDVILKPCLEYSLLWKIFLAGQEISFTDYVKVNENVPVSYIADVTQEVEKSLGRNTFVEWGLTDLITRIKRHEQINKQTSKSTVRLKDILLCAVVRDMNEN